MLFIALTAIIIAITTQLALATSATDDAGDFNFIADVEVSWQTGSTSNSITGRVYCDNRVNTVTVVPSTDSSRIISTKGKSQVAVAECGGGSTADQKAKSQSVDSLDVGKQMLIRAASLLAWDATDFTKSSEQHLTRIPVTVREDATCIPAFEKSSSCSCQCLFAFESASWVSESRQPLHAVEIKNCNSNCFPRTYISIMSFYRIDMPPDMITSCPKKNPSSSSSSTKFNAGGTQLDVEAADAELVALIRQPAGTTLTPFPKLPSEFAANMKVTLLEYGVTVDFTEVFSARHQAARTTVMNTGRNALGEIADVETWLTHGTAGVTYRLVHDVVAGSIAAEGVDRFSGTRECEKMVFSNSDEFFASSVDKLLLVPSIYPPVNAGPATVRGILCDRWTQAVSEDIRIDWYFDSSTSTTGKRLPRRIVLRGKGRSPFFAHHPFLPNSVHLAKADSDYCDIRPFFFDVHCDGSTVTSKTEFHHVIDIAQMHNDGIARNRSVFKTPDICAGASEVSSSCGSGVSPIIVFFLCICCAILGFATSRAMSSNDSKKKKRSSTSSNQEDDISNNNHVHDSTIADQRVVANIDDEVRAARAVNQTSDDGSDTDVVADASQTQNSNNNNNTLVADDQGAKFRQHHEA